MNITNINIFNEKSSIFSKKTTNDLTNSEWMLEIKKTKQNDIEWLGVYLKLMHLPRSITMMGVNCCFEINDVNDDNIRSVISRNVEYCSWRESKGYQHFIPLKIIEKYSQEITINCWFSIEFINRKPWVGNLSLVDKRMITF